MTRRLLVVVLFCFPAPCFSAGQPPYAVEDAASMGNFRDIYNIMDTHRHDGKDSRKTNVAPPKTAIQGTIISESAGEFYFDSIDQVVCVSTETGSSTSWVLMHSTSTPCGH